MKLITDDLINAVATDLAFDEHFRYAPPAYYDTAKAALESACPLIVRRCLRHIDAHHDEFIDGHNGKEYFEIVDEILIKVKAALRELIEENG